MRVSCDSGWMYLYLYGKDPGKGPVKYYKSSRAARAAAEQDSCDIVEQQPSSIMACCER